jgi:hypothetical protein
MKIKLFKFSREFDSEESIQIKIDKWTPGKDITKVSTKVSDKAIVLTILYNEPQ